MSEERSTPVVKRLAHHLDGLVDSDAFLATVVAYCEALESVRLTPEVDAMPNVKVQVELPTDLVVALGVEPARLGQHAVEWILLALLQEGRISTGKAAEILGISKAAMIDFLAHRGLPYLIDDPQDLDSDLQVALEARRAGL